MSTRDRGSSKRNSTASPVFTKHLHLLLKLLFSGIQYNMSSRDGGRSRRHSNRHSSRRRKEKQRKHNLTQEDIEYLKKNTRYDESEIREWYKGFKVL